MENFGGFDDFDGSSSFDLFGKISIIFMIVVGVLVFGIIIFAVVNGLSRWRKNNNSPRLTVDASLVSKRMDVRHHHHSGSGDSISHSTSHSYYYVTFQVASGDRMELSVDGYEYGLLAEGDRGLLTFQGTRYLGFKRTN